jgi:hypothetical protein
MTGGKFLAEALVGETQFLQLTERRGLDEELRRAEQLREDFAIGAILFQTENNTALVRVGVDEREAALGMLDVAGERRKQTVRIATRRLDLDDVGAQVGELTCRVGRRDVAQLDNAEMAEGAVVIVGDLI